MKFVSLALSLLLAVGSQARAVQSDAPSQLEHIKAAATVYLTRVKETAEKTLEHLDGTQYAEYKLKLSESFDRLHEYTQTASQTLTPYGDAFTAQFLEATKQAREKVMADVEDLRTRLEPKREELRQVLQKHIDEYREKLDPVLQEYISKNQGDMEALRVKLQPLVEEMRAKVQVNVEETKSKLLPIVEVVRTKLTENLEELKNMASPYAAEYKEHLVKAVDDVKKNVSPHTADLQSKLEPYFEDLKSKFMALYETVAKKV
ncbi:apolipoprotein A-I [Esox lucius]|uniref:apolipoprotein A-I n=1 Tax=Esox lucius TaxID=8010 RepID=UPI000577250A|nr:apolipoprotein A-I [Esox lucius]